jgi:hypothetical protein
VRQHGTEEPLGPTILTLTASSQGNCKAYQIPQVYSFFDPKLILFVPFTFRGKVNGWYKMWLALLLVGSVVCAPFVDNNLRVTELNLPGVYTVVSFLGQARVGKSTLINTIVGRDVAVTSNTTESCTRGIQAYIAGDLLLLDLEGDDLAETLPLSLLASSISHVVFYMARDKYNAHSARAMEYIRLKNLQWNVGVTYALILRTNLVAPTSTPGFVATFAYSEVTKIRDPLLRFVSQARVTAPGHSILLAARENAKRITNHLPPKPISYLEAELTRTCQRLLDACNLQVCDLGSCPEPWRSRIWEKWYTEHCRYILQNPEGADPADCKITWWRERILEAQKRLRREKRLESELAEQRHHHDDSGAILGVLGIFAALLSDVRFKTDVVLQRWVPELGLGWYCWRYIHFGTKCGFLAQEVARVAPHRVCDFGSVMFLC